MTDYVVPIPDRDSKPWWDAVARHELIHQRCSACGAWRWPPRAMCNRCYGFEWSWQPVSGKGTIVSFIRTHHPFLAYMKAPYYTVFVAIDEQPDIIMPGSWLSEATPDCGDAVEVAYDDIPRDEGQEPVALVGWRPAQTK
jgi:uncharacterized OB-fold protein